MALREFMDGDGTRWKVWDVAPQEPRTLRPLHAAGAPQGAAAERRRGAAVMEHGWLCFEKAGEKRRLAPVPQGWDALPDGDLPGLLGDARRVDRRDG
ncbi:MAG: hypothetical protein JWM27_4125 [Gemmatimonadetes bacterium]|nr:hypothetical protein [Gemmatimonadota bacterium]